MGHGVKVPGSKLARVLLADSLRGANWPGSEKAVNQQYNATVTDDRVTRGIWTWWRCSRGFVSGKWRRYGRWTPNLRDSENRQ